MRAGRGRNAQKSRDQPISRYQIMGVINGPTNKRTDGPTNREDGRVVIDKIQLLFCSNLHCLGEEYGTSNDSPTHGNGLNSIPQNSNGNSTSSPATPRRNHKAKIDPRLAVSWSWKMNE